MKKLVRGIVEFRRNLLPEYIEKFSRLALGQSPDALFIACSDSRVVPNLFASTDPGDLFVVRNVGNLIPCCHDNGHASAEESEAAAIEFALSKLNVRDIVICGHSDCGAMHALLQGRESVPVPNLRAWLRHGESALRRLREDRRAEATATEPVNRLSQLNVLQQLDHLRTYPLVRERIARGELRLHGWWFDLHTAGVHAYEEGLGDFVLIDEQEAERILARFAENARS